MVLGFEPVDYGQQLPDSLHDGEQLPLRNAPSERLRQVRLDRARVKSHRDRLRRPPRQFYREGAMQLVEGRFRGSVAIPPSSAVIPDASDSGRERGDYRRAVSREPRHERLKYERGTHGVELESSEKASTVQVFEALLGREPLSVENAGHVEHEVEHRVSFQDRGGSRLDRRVVQEVEPVNLKALGVRRGKLSQSRGCFRVATGGVNTGRTALEERFDKAEPEAAAGSLDDTNLEALRYCHRYSRGSWTPLLGLTTWSVTRASPILTKLVVPAWTCTAETRSRLIESIRSRSRSDTMAR